MNVISVSATSGSSVPKRVREEEQESSSEVTDTTQDDPAHPPISKKLRIIRRVCLEVSSVCTFFVMKTLGFLRFECILDD